MRVNDKEENVMFFVNEKLQEFERYIYNKKIAIIGLGISNLPLLDYFADKGAQVTVFDHRKIDEIDKVILDKITSRCIKFSFGKHCLVNLVGFDIIFRSPTCRPDINELKAIQKKILDNASKSVKPGGVLLYSGQHRAHQLGKEVPVVTGDGDILADAQPAVADGIQTADGCHVVGHEDAGGRLGQLEQLLQLHQFCIILLL